MNGDNQRCVTAVRQFLEGVYGGTWEWYLGPEGVIKHKYCLPACLM